MKTKPRMLAPSECNTHEKVCMLNRNVVETPRAWASIDSTDVTIWAGSGDFVRITIADMRKFARWFLRKQRCK